MKRRVDYWGAKGPVGPPPKLFFLGGGGGAGPPFPTPMQMTLISAGREAFSCAIEIGLALKSGDL